ncbi:MAG: DUF2167 domain-containing protein [Chitinophagaceae bacterium]|nr:DUF2167 domain-containing protein [Chitinophagaceae bacterium]
MKTKLLNLILFLSFPFLSFGQADSTQLRIDEIEKSLVYQTGVVDLGPGNAILNIPKELRFLDKKQSAYVLSDLWGNPEDTSVLGLLVPANRGVLADNSWVFTVSYDEMGYVKDDDAESIDYNELLKKMQEETEAENPERQKQGYSAVHLIGWASAPYYDKEQKVLHWAKELRFGEDSIPTLNYNLRVLGRKGVFMLNAVASIHSLEEVKQNIGPVMGSIQFKRGSQYKDFNPEFDKVAAWTVGGLVAGKILAKAGFIALLLKFWKLILVAFAGVGAAIRKFVKRRKKGDDSDGMVTVATQENADPAL